MSKTPHYDQKIAAILASTKPNERVCAVTGETWTMTQTDLDMYRQFNVPPMGVSPATFYKQSWCLHTGNSWWWNKDATTGKPILTAIHPATKYKVISDEEWYQRDFSELGRDIDVRRPFFDQMYDLATTVPMSATKNVEKPVNSIARISLGDQDSYFVQGCQSKRSYNCTDSLNIEDCADVTWSQNIRESFDVMHCDNIANGIVVRESKNCLQCAFVFDCRDCEYCFMSWNKRRKKFLWENNQLSETEWKKRWRELSLESHRMFENLREKFHAAVGSIVVWPENFNTKCENSTGDYLQNCVNVEHGWYCDGAKDCRWTCWGNLGTERSCFGADPGTNEGYGNIASIKCSRVKFNYFVSHCQNVEYSIECHECENCFGCVGLRRKKFHILNKEYAEQDYWKKLDELKAAMLDRGEYGKVFPIKFTFTPFEYCPAEVACEFSTSDKEKIGVWQIDASQNGAYGDWSGEVIEDIRQIPDNIRDVPDAIVGRAFMDKKRNRPMSVLAPELAFYRAHRLPMPRKHYVTRIEEQWKGLNTFLTVKASCASCAKSLEVANNRLYRHRTIYCRDCYLKYLETHG